MRSPSRRLVFAAVVLAATGVFVALGLWQLDRLRERRAENRRARARLRRPPVEPGALFRDAPGSGAGPGASSAPAAPALAPDSLDRRRVVLRGRFDYAREMLLAPRSFQGTPGVYLLTPLVVGDSTAVAVLRGSMPAPDGFHAELAVARPPGPAAPPAAGDRAARGVGDSLSTDPKRAPPGPTVTVRGVALLPPDVDPVERPDTLRSAGGAHPVLPRLDLARVDALLPWRVPGVYVRADSTTEAIPPADGIRVPVPVPPPELDDGPHLMYAIQWFSFAAIALVGGGIVLGRRGAAETDAAGEG